MASSTTTPLSSKLETLSYVHGMVEAFKAFDSDADGLITADELRGIMTSIGYKTNDQEIGDMMRRGDTDGDGLLSAEEFLGVVTADVADELVDVGDLAGLLEAALLALDVDGSATMTTMVRGEELYEVLSCMGRLSAKDCMDVVASLDEDGDGEVNIVDLKLIVQALV